MEEDTQNIHLKRLHSRLGEIVYQLTQIQFSQFGPAQAWRPALNMYLYSRQIVVCVDLAGMEKETLNLRVEPRRLRIGGRREPPEPSGIEETALQVLSMEIDYGCFERDILLPAEVEPERVTAQQRNGLLWVYLPLRLPA